MINSENFRNLNDQLKNGCILLQGYGIRSPGELRYEAFPFDNQDKEQYKWSHHKAVLKLKEHLDLKHHCGFLTFVNTGVPDIGCEQYELEVKLKHPKSKLKANKKDAITKEPVPNNIKEISENSEPKDLLSPDQTELCSFTRPSNSPQHNLKTPDENYFASTTAEDNNEPSAVYTSADCSELLATELASCGKMELVSQGSVEIPLDRETVQQQLVQQPIDEEDTSEDWTLLDVNFGVPLFDVDMNTRICEQIVRNLSTEENLKELPRKSAEMSEKFYNFIKQCLYFEDEQVDQLKIGKNLPHPRINLAFENGKVCYWNGR